MCIQQTTIPPSYNGARLDKALALLLPDAGMRLRRRYIEQGLITLNGKKMPKGAAVHTGDVLELNTETGNGLNEQSLPADSANHSDLSLDQHQPDNHQCPTPENDENVEDKPATDGDTTNGTRSEDGTEGNSHDSHLQSALLSPADTTSHTPSSTQLSRGSLHEWQQLVHIVHSTDAFVAIYKPDGLHTAAIAGKPTPSLEALLPSLFPAEDNAGATPIPELINRLDMLTSGMVMAAFSAEHAHRFREYENSGCVEKLYLTLLHGELHTPMGIDAALDTANRKITRVMETPSSDPLRHTGLLPLHRLELFGHPCTLTLASIHKGARHQIRAHCAHAGYPIVGDPLYGKASGIKGDNTHSGNQSRIMYLHHYHIEMPDFVATCTPLWPQWAQWSRHLNRSARG